MISYPPRISMTGLKIINMVRTTIIHSEIFRFEQNESCKLAIDKGRICTYKKTNDIKQSDTVILDKL